MVCWQISSIFVSSPYAHYRRLNSGRLAKCTVAIYYKITLASLWQTWAETSANRGPWLPWTPLIGTKDLQPTDGPKKKERVKTNDPLHSPSKKNYSMDCLMECEVKYVTEIRSQSCYLFKNNHKDTHQPYKTPYGCSVTFKHISCSTSPHPERIIVLQSTCHLFSRQFFLSSIIVLCCSLRMLHDVQAIFLDGELAAT